MYNLLNIYDCPNCGKVLSDQCTHGDDIENDEVYHRVMCNKCRSDVKIRTTKDTETGQIIYHYEEVDDERAKWANGFYDDFMSENIPNL